MPIHGTEVTEFGLKHYNAIALQLKGKSKTVKLRTWETQTKSTPLGDKVISVLKKYDVTGDEFCQSFKEAYEEGAGDQNTVPVDNLLYIIDFASFAYKSWYNGVFADSERMNAEAIVRNDGTPIPSGVFESTELELFFELSKYACGDAGAFPGQINNTRDYYYTSQVLNRASQVQRDSVRFQAATSAQGAGGGGIGKAKSLSQAISEADSLLALSKKARSAVCFTFAWASVTPLLKRLRSLAVSQKTAGLNRVEIVAYTNHVFVLVNREGAAVKPNDMLPGTAEWNADVVRLDTWLGSLGEPYIVEGTGGPNECFLYPLTSIFDSKT